MPFQETKVYYDGSHYIAIPHTSRPKRPRATSKGEAIATRKEPVAVEVEADELPFPTSVQLDVDDISSNADRITTNETTVIDGDIPVKKQISERDILIEKERKKRNAVCRRVRCVRKANLQGFNYFVTFTYDGELHTEVSFKKKLKCCLAHNCTRVGWKYIGVWERSPEKKRLHFHGIFHIPESTMPGVMIEVNDYSFRTHKRQVTVQNTYFNENFGRSDFEIIKGRNGLSDALAYIMKYIEKTGERIVYSKGLPQFFISDIMEDDVVCRIGSEEKKLLLYDNFNCYDDGEFIGTVGRDTIKRLRTAN